MHLPDGFINNGAAGPLLGAAGAFAAVAFNKVRQKITQRIAVTQRKLATFPATEQSLTKKTTTLSSAGRQYIVRAFTVGAIIFLIQMIDVPIIAGVSGHLLGSAMAALALGPWGGMLLMSVILFLQATLLADGGMVALGLNIISMAIIPTWLAWVLYAWLQKRIRATLAIVSSVWLSVMTAALMVALYIQLAGYSPFSFSAIELLQVHIIIGVAESIITLLVLLLLKRQGNPPAATL